MTNSPTLNDDSELRAKLYWELPECNEHYGGFDCNDGIGDFICHRHKDQLDRIMAFVHQRDEARDKEIRIDEFKTADKYIDLDYIECNGWKCRLPWCGSCNGEDEASQASYDLKKERADRLEQLTTPKKTNNN